MKKQQRVLAAVRAPSQTRALDAVGDAIDRAEYVVAHLLLAELRPVTVFERARCELLRARLARIEGDVATWERAAAYAAEHHADPACHLLALALLAGARKRAGDRDGAERLFARVRSEAKLVSPEHAGVATYLAALHDWQERRYDHAERIVSDNVIANANVAESLTLWGWIEVKRERYRSAGEHFARAIAHIRKEGGADVRLQASTIHALSLVASETIDLSAGRRVAREFAACTWPAALSAYRFNTMLSLHHLALLEGDLERAWVIARDAAAAAPTPSCAAMGETVAAVATRLLGDETTADLQMRRAADLIEKIRWGSADTEERVALTNFAIEFAWALPAQARGAITRYQSLTAKANPLNALELDRRVTAFEKTAAARVSESGGERETALRLYREALALWSALDYRMQAALVALNIRRFGGDEAANAALAIARERAPNAWFLRDVPAPAGPIERKRAPKRRAASAKRSR